MKLFIKNIFLFFIILVVCYPILISFTGHIIPQLFKPNINYHLGSYGHLYTRINQIKNSFAKTDVLFLGSSHTYRGFDPRNFQNLKSFNLGSSAQTPINTNVLLKRYLAKINPKIVLYEVYPGNFSSDGVESSLDIIANDKNDCWSIVMATKINNIKTYNTLIYGFFRDCFKLNNSFFENEIKDKDKYISGGFIERKIEYYRYNRIDANKNWQINDNQIKAFNKNIQFIKSYGIKPILIFAPITKGLYNSYKNNAYIDSLMRSYELPYYNFNEIIQLDDSLDFYDAHHLNQNGVNKFNSKLKEILPEIFIKKSYEK